MDRLAWIPDWPLPPPDEIRFEATSSVYSGLNPALPASEMTVGLELLDVRGGARLVEVPSAGNAFTTVLELDDIFWLSSDFYRVRLTFTPQAVPEPSSVMLTCAGGLGLLAAARRRRRAAA